MRKKQALVVDDSKTARIVIAKRLKEQGLDVDTVDSAGAAIDYLCDKIPNVIFMDYEMPGMDGFQALKAIKSNPSTATIPVLMYTSKSDQLHVGQARALGAIGVLPKEAQDKALTDILGELRLLPGQDTSKDETEPAIEQAAFTKFHSKPSPGHSAPLSLEAKNNLESIAQQAEKSMQAEREIVLLKRQLKQYHHRITQDIETQNAKLASDLQEQLDGLHISLQDSRSNRTTLKYWILGLLALILIIPAFFMYNSWNQANSERNSLAKALGLSQKKGQQLERENARLIQLEMAVSANNPAQPPSAPPINLTAITSTLEWAVNRNTHFPHPEYAFGEQRIPWLSDLLTHLSAIQFKGTLTLTSHLGRFCLIETPSGNMLLASDDLPAGQCLFKELAPIEAKHTGAFQTIGFSNYLATTPNLSDGKIRVEVSSEGFARPLTEYPSSEGLTAKQWNQTAQQNQHIQISLTPTAEN